MLIGSQDYKNNKQKTTTTRKQDAKQKHIQFL